LQTRSKGELEHEEERLKALYEYDVLDTPAEESFDRITRIAMRALQVPMAMVSLVDRDRQWFKSRQGLEAKETSRAVSFCDHTVRGSEPLVVSDALSDPRFCNSPLVTGAPHIRAYVGIPLRTPSGHNIGALCISDVRPRDITQEQIDTLQDLGRIGIDELELRKLTTIDALTGAMSADAFIKAGNQQIRLVRRSGQDLSCGLFGIDNFNEVNETFGRATADAWAVLSLHVMLKLVTRTLSAVSGMESLAFYCLIGQPGEPSRSPKSFEKKSHFFRIRRAPL
jgi:GAF domain-containing protein